tara:strand:- start:1415 stop:1705 length:291 start_codon:yes stop_codon:yes gene_type:complete
MLIKDDPNIYFSDFGQDVYFQDKVKKGILNMPDEILAGDMIISSDYVLHVITNDFKDVNLGDFLLIDLNNEKINFEVRSKRMEDDGLISLITLSKT